MPYQSSVAFDSIVVIESLEAQFATGIALFHATIAPQCRVHNVYTELYQVASAKQFFGALEAV